MVNDKRKVAILRWGLVILIVLCGLGFYQFRMLIFEEGLIDVSFQLRVAELVGWVILFILLAFSIYSWAGGAEFILSWLSWCMNLLRRMRVISLPALLFLFGLYPILVIGHYGVYLNNLFTRVSVYLVFVLIGAALLSVWQQKKTWVEMLPVSLLLLAAIYYVASYIPSISTYPLALDWSETSRYYYGSTFFSESIYGQDIPWPHSNFSRYLMQSVPFLNSSLPLWAHRLWQVILRVAFPFLTGFILSRRLGFENRRKTYLFTLWAGLFIFQGPVFYQLLVIVMLVFWLFDSSKFWRSLILIIITSIWAGFSRINWVPMPGLMAATFYLMECPVIGRDGKSLLRYLRPLAVWVVVGGLVGLGAQKWYQLNSGLPDEVFTAHFTQNLLWYRLWPNLSYRVGILPAIMLVSGPLLIYVGIAVKGWKSRWHPLRVLGLGAILLVFFAGGLAISVKIGGGTNLHNLDAYLTILLMVGVYLYFGKVVNTVGKEKAVKPGWLHLALIVLIPALFTVLYGYQAPERDFELAEWVLDRIQLYVERASTDGGEILFVSQRHLITFDMIEGVELVHDYEKMILMEMAMADNQAYLDLFSKDLEAQRFSLIVHDHLPGRHKEKDEFSLAEENNVYLERVASIILCNYEIKKRISEVGIDILVPKDNQICE